MYVGFYGWRSDNFLNRAEFTTCRQLVRYFTCVLRMSAFVDQWTAPDQPIFHFCLLYHTNRYMWIGLREKQRVSLIVYVVTLMFIGSDADLLSFFLWLLSRDLYLAQSISLLAYPHCCTLSMGSNVHTSSQVTGRVSGFCT